MDYLKFYILFNSISVIPESWKGESERLCAVESCLHVKRSLSAVGVEPGIARLVGQCLIR